MKVFIKIISNTVHKCLKILVFINMINNANPIFAAYTDSRNKLI